MKVCVIGKGRAVITEGDVPTPGRRDVLIGMKACGICGTDVEKIAGNYSSTILGHEAVGVVEEVGKDTSEVSVGERVFPHHHVPCYNCHFCRSGSETMCPHFSRSNLDPGGLAEHFLLPEWNLDHGGLFPLPPSLSYRTGTLIEPLACVLRGINRIRASPESTVLVIGAGPVGMLQIYALRALGVENVVAMDVSEERCRFAKRLGAVAAGTVAEDIISLVSDISDGRGADTSIVATGHPQATETGISALRKGGRLLQFGLPHPGTTLIHDVSDMFRKEIEYINTYSGIEKDVDQAIALLNLKKGMAEEIISHSFSLEEAPRAFELAEKPGISRKIIIEN